MDNSFYFLYDEQPQEEPAITTGLKGGEPTPEEYEQAMQEMYGV